MRGTTCRRTAQEQYLEWLHDTYIPKLLKYPAHTLGGALQDATSRSSRCRGCATRRKRCPGDIAYIFLLGAEDAHAFSALTPYNQKGKVDPADQKMLDMRVGERLNIFTEEGARRRPDAKEREGQYTPAPCIQFGSFNAGAPEDEDELLAWYADYRLPAMGEIPSSIGMRKLASVSGWAKHGVMYEFTSLEARAKNFRAHEAKNKKTADWTEEVIAKLVHAPGSPNVARAHLSPVPQ